MNCEKKLMEYFYSSILKPGLHKVKQPQAAGYPSLGSQHATSDPSSDMINTKKSFWALRSPKIFTSLFYWTCTAKFLVESLRFWHYQICITNSILQLSKRCIRFRLYSITISIRTRVFRIKLVFIGSFFEHQFENAFQHYLMDWFRLFKKKHWMKVGYQLLKRNGENSKTAKMSISLKRYGTRRNLRPEDTRFYVIGIN